jgi:hypothetical protein
MRKLLHSLMLFAIKKKVGSLPFIQIFNRSMKSLFLFISLVLFLNWNTYLAQSFDRKVMASSGKESYNSQSGYTMTYTIGEAIIQGKSNANIGILSNGFIQTSVASVSPFGFLQPGDIVVYPNPFETKISINDDDRLNEEINVQLIDQQGKIIVEEMIIPNNYVLNIPEECAPGIYMLNLYSTAGQFIQQKRLIKLNQ